MNRGFSLVAVIIGVAAILGLGTYMYFQRGASEVVTNVTSPIAVNVLKESTSTPPPETCATVSGISSAGEGVKVEKVISGGFEVVTAPYEYYGDEPLPEIRFTALVDQNVVVCDGAVQESYDLVRKAAPGTFFFLKAKELMVQNPNGEWRMNYDVKNGMVVHVTRIVFE